MYDNNDRAMAYERKQRERKRLIEERRRWRKTRSQRKRKLILSTVLAICLLGSIYLYKEPLLAQIEQFVPGMGAGSSPTVSIEIKNENNELVTKVSVSKLDELLSTYPDVQHLIDKKEQYPEKVIDLVLKNPETIPFALDYIEQYPSNDTDKDIDVTKDYKEGEIPLFLQWDKRWGYDKYSGRAMGFTGCGPTALSMVVMGLTGDISKHPKVLADFATNEGYAVEGFGSSWSLMSEGAKKFGLAVDRLTLSEKVIKNTLEAGKPIIAVMGPGDFTQKGHFIVMTGMTDDGKVKVNDPNSMKNSQQEWDIDVFMKQTKNLWAFEVE